MKKTNTFVRILCLAMAMLMLFAFVSCKEDPKDNDNPPSKNEEVLASSIADLINRVMEMEDMSLDEETRSTVVSYVKSDVLKAFESNGITDDEIKAIIAACNHFLDTAPTISDTDTYGIANCLATLYNSTIGILGSDRFGAIMYDGIIAYYNIMIAEYQKMAAEDPDMTYIIELIQEARDQFVNDISKDSFAEMCGVLYFTGSLASGSIDTWLNKSGEIVFDESNYADLLDLLRRETEYLASLDITADEWETFYNFVYTDFSYDIEEIPEEYYDLYYPQIIIESMVGSALRTMPALLDYIDVIADAITVDDIKAMVEEPYTMAELLTTILARIAEDDKAACLDLLNAIATNFASASDDDYLMLKNLGLEADYLVWKNDVPDASAEMVYDALVAFINNPTDGNQNNLIMNGLGFAHSFMPYKTYIMMYSDLFESNEEGNMSQIPA